MVAHFCRSGRKFHGGQDKEYLPWSRNMLHWAGILRQNDDKEQCRSERRCLQSNLEVAASSKIMRKGNKETRKQGGKKTLLKTISSPSE